MDILTKIEQIITPTVTEMGYELVRVLLQGAETNKTLQIMAERQDRKDMQVEDCEQLSRAVSALLDVEDPIRARYTLEVTSPGIDRPLVKPADYERFKGYEMKLETLVPLEGRRRFKGRLSGYDAAADQVLMTFEGAEIRIPFAQISKAKLVLTDELMASFLKNS